MAKTLNKKPSNQKNNIAKNIIPEKFQNAILVTLLCVLILIFFREPLFGDGSFWGASDSIIGVCFKNFLEQADQFPQWVPYIFAGLPGYAAAIFHAVKIWDFTYLPFQYAAEILGYIFNSDAAKWMFWYLIMVSGMYFLMRQHKFERLISFWTAFAFIFCTGILAWIIIGHNAKEMTFAVTPWIFFMMEKIKEKISLLNVVILTILMHIMLAGGHVQIIFYIACVVVIYLIFDLVSKLMKKENWMSVVKLIGAFFIASALAFLMSADKYLVTLEYVPYSTRGSSPITERINETTTDKAVSNKRTEEDYKYATSWSNSPEELIDMFVPSYHGFGKVNYSGYLTNNQEVRLNTYWGQKPFEDATPYMGAIVLFLALIGIFRFFRESVFVKALTITSIFAILLSFGYTMPVLYDLFFYYVPMFSSFRAPVMVYVLLHFAMPILAAFGLKALCEMREKYGNFKTLPNTDKIPLLIFLCSIGIFIIAGFIFANGFETSYIADVSNALNKYYGEQTAPYIAQFAFDNAVSDWTIIGLLCFILAILSYIFVNKKLSPNVFVIAVIIITMIDLWRISNRSMEFVSKSIEKQPFQQTDIINYIKSDLENERFRICDLASNVPNYSAYFFIENVNGYIPTKLRTYQDMMDIMCGGSTSTVSHPFLWDLMNVKYIISDKELGGQPLFQSQQTGHYIYYNPSYCSRAFFVDSVIVEPDDYKILMQLNSKLDKTIGYYTHNFNPKTLAYIEKPLSEDIVPSGQYALEMKELEMQLQKTDPTYKLADSVVVPDFVPKAKIVEYKNEYIKIETETKGQHLLVLSEMYYPVSWKAYIDGQETEIYKTNFGFRSVVVPAGEHTVEFKFTSEMFTLGRNLSAGTNIAVIIALIIGIVLERKRKKM
ncbi:MAG: YfhO family protein [Bacteroidetes bacterium]|nr:YfhO family protein [Bacteroidota bacterium]